MPRGNGGQYLPNPKDIPQTAEEESWNSRRIRFQLACMPEFPLKLTDPDHVQIGMQRLKRYLELCDEYKMKVGNQACYFALGVNKDDVYSWTSGKYGKSNPRMTDFLKNVKNLCATYREGMMEDNQVPVVAGIFWQKNYDGLSDVQQIAVTTTDPLGSTEAPERLAERYLDKLPNKPQLTLDTLPDLCETKSD